MKDDEEPHRLGEDTRQGPDPDHIPGGEDPINLEVIQGAIGDVILLAVVLVYHPHSQVNHVVGVIPVLSLIIQRLNIVVEGIVDILARLLRHLHHQETLLTENGDVEGGPILLSVDDILVINVQEKMEEVSEADPDPGLGPQSLQKNPGDILLPRHLAVPDRD